VELQRLVRDEGTTPIPMFFSTLEAYSDKLDHNKIASNWEIDGMRISGSWWFKL
jgi:peptide/nickel transport system substrate-binding protein